MIRLLTLILIAVAISIGLGWMLDNNGIVEINWLGYEIITDVFTTFVVITIATILIFILSYIIISFFSLRIFRIFSKNKKLK